MKEPKSVEFDLVCMACGESEYMNMTIVPLCKRCAFLMWLGATVNDMNEDSVRAEFGLPPLSI